MKYGDKLYVINVDELYKSTFLMEAPDTHEYIVEYDKRHCKMTHLAIRKMNKERCIPYTERSIVEFYNSQIQEKRLNVSKIEEGIKI
ncbi:hypothetical protein [Clostridium botulinum]|uniref:hypothetical protein n=1 Tax=Clostridium botulinum TaxID=1491 RepID=UPI001E576E7A|nr:hypothetical protein [Clostridium botulinum]MCD3329307.1 hypothetical protein [Clostridium botulinum D/C]